MVQASKIGAMEITSEIIEQLVDHGPAGVRETARALDRPKSTVHDYFQSLATQGFVVNEGGSYRLSMRFLAVGEQTRNELPVYHSAREPLQVLAQQVNLHVSLTIEEHGRIVLIDTVPGEDPVSLATHGGIQMAMHTTSPGKAILAHLPEERIDEIIDRYGLTSMTEHTITDRDRLDAELQEVRDDGYAIDDEERLVGLRTVAVPVIDRKDTVHGALTIYGPKHRITAEQFHDVLPRRLQEAANVVEMNLNY